MAKPARAMIGAMTTAPPTFHARTRQRPTRPGKPTGLLTLREAAEMTGLRRAVLRERIERGHVPVRVIGKGRAAKLRLTKTELVAAGLLLDPDGSPAVANPVAVTVVPTNEVETGDLATLLELIREQGNRISTLEDHRFQLAGQLGAALERTRALEERLLALAEPTPRPKKPKRRATETDGRVQPAAVTPEPSPIETVADVSEIPTLQPPHEEGEHAAPILVGIDGTRTRVQRLMAAARPIPTMPLRVLPRRMAVLLRPRRRAATH